MPKKNSLLVGILLALGLAGVGVSPALAAPIVDQTQTGLFGGEAPVDCFFPAFSSEPQCSNWGSTFTAGLSGRLTSIEDIRYVRTRGVVTDDLTATLWNVDSTTGLPTGSAIATQVIRGSSLVSGGGTISVVFSNPATVTAGTRYGFLLEFPLSSASSSPRVDLAMSFSPADKRLLDRLNVYSLYGINFTTYVDNAPQAPLANTGTSESVIGVSAAISGGLLAAGALAIVVARRRSHA